MAMKLDWSTDCTSMVEQRDPSDFSDGVDNDSQLSSNDVVGMVENASVRSEQCNN